MSLKTKLLELFKYEPDKDGAQTFNIKSALNDNWDKIEAWAQSVKTALAGLVPTGRKVNGKALAEDVTLTGDDIAMGADDAESLRTAMAKRLGSRAKYLAGTSIFDYMKSEYNAGHHAGFIHAINCPDIPNGEKEWGYNVFFFMEKTMLPMHCDLTLVFQM